MIGAGAGSEYGILPYFLTRLFGLRAFGLLYGAIYAIAAIGSAIGPYTMGRVFDLTGSYAGSLMAFEAVMVLTILVMIFLPRYRYAADGTPHRPSGNTGVGVVRPTWQELTGGDGSLA